MRLHYHDNEKTYTFKGFLKFFDKFFVGTIFQWFHETFFIQRIPTENVLELDEEFTAKNAN